MHINKLKEVKKILIIIMKIIQLKEIKKKIKINKLKIQYTKHLINEEKNKKILHEN